MARRSFKTPAARYPADPRAVFILVMCVVSGVPLVQGHATPGSVNSQLNPYQVVVWGALLVFGALVTLIGTFNQRVTGIILEQIGSVAVGFACLIYAAAIAAQIGVLGTVPALIVLGFGLACFWRWGQLQSLMHHAEQQASRNAAERGE
jgi:hypothetical protein